MRRLLTVLASLVLSLCFLADSTYARHKKRTESDSADGRGITQAGQPPQQPCVILKRMGPADEVTSHLYSFGFRGKQFQYQEGQLPRGVKFHGRLTDNDVRKIQGAGGRVEIIDAHYSEQELDQARKVCSSPISGASVPAVALLPLVVNSMPGGADITVDGKYAGSTPSKLELAPGTHTIAIQMSGYASWQRTMTITSGEKISINPRLDKKPPAESR